MKLKREQAKDWLEESLLSAAAETSVMGCCTGDCAVEVRSWRLVHQHGMERWSYEWPKGMVILQYLETEISTMGDMADTFIVVGTVEEPSWWG